LRGRKVQQTCRSCKTFSPLREEHPASLSRLRLGLSPPSLKNSPFLLATLPFSLPPPELAEVSKSRRNSSFDPFVEAHIRCCDFGPVVSPLSLPFALMSEQRMTDSADEGVPYASARGVIFSPPALRRSFASPLDTEELDYYSLIPSEISPSPDNPPPHLAPKVLRRSPSPTQSMTCPSAFPFGRVSTFFSSPLNLILEEL